MSDEEFPGTAADLMDQAEAMLDHARRTYGQGKMVDSLSFLADLGTLSSAAWGKVRDEARAAGLMP